MGRPKRRPQRTWQSTTVPKPWNSAAICLSEAPLARPLQKMAQGGASAAARCWLGRAMSSTAARVDVPVRSVNWTCRQNGTRSAAFGVLPSCRRAWQTKGG